MISNDDARQRQRQDDMVKNKHCVDYRFNDGPSVVAGYAGDLYKSIGYRKRNMMMVYCRYLVPKMYYGHGYHKRIKLQQRIVICVPG